MKLIALLIALVAPSVMACEPSNLGGTGTAAVVEINAVGGAVSWWCGPVPQLALYAVRWDAMGPELRDALMALPIAPDKAAAMLALGSFRNTDLQALRDVWGPAAERIQASKPRLTWVVAPAPANANPPNTRPTYSVEGDVLLNTGQRATSATACDCALRTLVRGPTTYCSVTPTTVAACVGRPAQ